MNIVKTNSHRAPIVLIHGAEGRGKTTLAANFPDPLFVDLERGFPAGVTADTIAGITDFNKLMNALREVYQQRGAGHRTLAIDTLDQVEALILAHTCAEHNWRTIETPPFGKGWVAADIVWRQFLRALIALRDIGLIIVLTAHTAIERIEDPRAPAYTSYVLRLHRRARALVMDAADVVGFLSDDIHILTEDSGFRERTRAVASPARFLFVEGAPAYAAKNRFALPSRIEVRKDFNVAAGLFQHINPQQPEEGHHESP